MKKFILNMFSGSNDVSSKRVNGTICILIILTLLSVSIIWDKDVSQSKIDWAIAVFWGGVSLLGVGVVDQYFRSKNGGE